MSTLRSTTSYSCISEFRTVNILIFVAKLFILECDQTVVDDGASTSVDRPQMRQLMEILEISDYKVLVVEDIYEITRNPEDLKSMMDRINDLGVTIFDLGTMSARYNNYAIEC